MPLKKLIGTCYVESGTNVITDLVDYLQNHQRGAYGASVGLTSRKPSELLYVSVKFRDEMSNNTATIKS